ncbi:MAG: GNAT family N-acetyltransferase [Phycisphaerales bacterium]|nr:MAG: GNAT family N-acetyltransferase [Phycisphaerales bacterium]
MTRESYTVRPPVDDDEVAALMENHRPIFAVPVERMAGYGKLVGRENFRLITAGEKLVGGLAIVHMGQFFGGRSVPTYGIAAVGIAAQVRGRGAATELMRQTIREAYERGCPLSTLYPATQPVYRYAGYEQAGCLYEITLPLDTVNMRNRSLNVRPIEEGDVETIKRVYTESVQHCNGPLDRGHYIWSRVFKPREGQADGFLVERDSRCEGYLYYIRREGGRIFYNLKCTDLVALTPEAGRRLLTFLADHRSLAEEAVIFRSPADPMWALLAEQTCRVKLEMQWMIRINDVVKALEGRGYPTGLNSEIHLEVADDLNEANHGRFVLRIADGEGKVERGGEGRLQIDIRGLAALYSGYRSPQQLSTAGLLKAEPADMVAAAGAFAGTGPWMAEQF